MPFDLSPFQVLFKLSLAEQSQGGAGSLLAGGSGQGAFGGPAGTGDWGP